MKERIRKFLQETFFLDAFADDESFLKTGKATVPPVNPLGTACPM